MVYSIAYSTSATIGFILLCVVAFFESTLRWHAIQTGAISRLQLYSCLSAFIAVWGHLTNGYGLYRYADTYKTPSSWCMLEAVTGCFGELALVLWQICVGLTMMFSFYPDWFSPERQTVVFTWFHVSVWSLSTISTIVPWSLGYLGVNNSGPTVTSPLTDDELTVWCWIVKGHQWFELGQVRCD
jgi:hypothetical protein